MKLCHFIPIVLFLLVVCRFDEVHAWTSLKSSSLVAPASSKTRRRRRRRPSSQQPFRQNSRFSHLNYLGTINTSNNSDNKPTTTTSLYTRISPDKYGNFNYNQDESDIEKQEKEEIVKYLERRRTAAENANSSLPLFAVAVSLFFVMVATAFGGSLFVKSSSSSQQPPKIIDAESVLQQDYQRLDTSVTFYE